MEKGESIVLDLASNKDKKGEYMADINLTKEGKWTVDAVVESGKDSFTTSFEVEVSKGGPNWVVVNGFLGLIVLVIVIAGVSKARRKKTPAATS